MSSSRTINSRVALFCLGAVGLKCSLVLAGLFFLGGLDKGRLVVLAAETDRGNLPSDYLHDEVNDGLVKEKSAVGKIRSEEKGDFSDEERKTLETYYNRYALPRWTRPTEKVYPFTDKGSPASDGYRTELRNELRGVKRPKVHEHITELALKYLSNVATKNYHPVARVNAMLAIGELNAVESLRSADLPEPLPAALDVMVQTVDSPQQIEAVKVAALAGILRHVRIDSAWKKREQKRQTAPISDEKKQQIIEALTKLIHERKPSAGNSPDVRYWMLNQAAEILGELRETANKELVERLEKLIQECQARLKEPQQD